MSFMDKIGESLDDAWDKAAHPVYNALGRNVGYFKSAEELAAGRILIYPGEQLPNFREWKVKNDIGIVVPAAEYIIGKGLRPFWMTGTEAQAQKQAKADAAPLKIPDLPNLRLDIPSLPVVPGLGGANLMVWGALGLLALALVLRRD
jgi:hypothetical protein